MKHLIAYASELTARFWSREMDTWIIELFRPSEVRLAVSGNRRVQSKLFKLRRDGLFVNYAQKSLQSIKTSKASGQWDIQNWVQILPSLHVKHSHFFQTFFWKSEFCKPDCLHQITKVADKYSSISTQWLQFFSQQKHQNCQDFYLEVANFDLLPHVWHDYWISRTIVMDFGVLYGAACVRWMVLNEFEQTGRCLTLECRVIWKLTIWIVQRHETRYIQAQHQFYFRTQWALMVILRNEPTTWG